VKGTHVRLMRRGKYGRMMSYAFQGGCRNVLEAVSGNFALPNRRRHSREVAVAGLREAMHVLEELIGALARADKWALVHLIM
jgi:hypothetical protein